MSLSEVLIVIELNEVYKVKDSIMYVRVLAEYTNGYDTTAGFYKEEDLIKANCLSITYDADHCTELPVDWPDRYFLDDNDKRQKIREIDFGNEFPYIMEDGTRSKGVTS